MSTESSDPPAYGSSRALALDDVTHWDVETDVIVVGYGAAGASAAIGAAAAGARVTLFEVASGRGGTSAMAGGDIYLGGNGGTPAQRENGFEDDTEDFYRYMLMAGGPDADAARVRFYAENALDHYHWLKEQGIPYRNTHLPGKVMAPGTGDCLIWSGNEAAWPFSEHARPCPRGHLPEAFGELGGGGRMIVDKLGDSAEAKGTEVHCDARVLALIADDAKRTHGVVVRLDGQVRFARARKGVILCSGGFVLNEEMLRLHAPQSRRLADDALSGGYDDGSGILMGQSVGGAAIHMDELFVTLAFYPPPSNVKGILVNQAGQRFVNEDAYPGRIAHQCTRQIGERVFLLTDNAIFQQPSELSRMEVAAVGESWAEVEREGGFVEGTLANTVEVFNRYAAKGEDPLFHKHEKWLAVLDEPPFAAIAMHPGEAFYPFFTLGGLHTKPTGEVLDHTGEALPGLYAAGRACSGLPRSAEFYSSGMSLGDCTFFGRLAGHSAAQVPG
jgi:succinate dehydrogenase/fumarate reductase flavoprotein subunit